jgi:hypothetical protein
MMPKVTMQAPAGVGGQIHASKTQQVYTVGSDGSVVVESADVSDLLGAGFTVVPPVAGGPGVEAAAPITSHSLTSDIEGAQALDPAARDLGAQEAATEAKPNQGDFGNATPPHGIDNHQATSAAEIQHDDAEAALVEQAKDLAGKPDAGTSANVAATAQKADDGKSVESKAAL